MFGTYGLVFAIQAIVISIADPLQVNAVAVGTGERLRWARGLWTTVFLVAGVAAIVVAIADPTILDAA